MSTTEVDRYSPFPPLQSGPRKRDTPPRARPKSRYEYVKAHHRFSTQAPLLSILPVLYSLTEGTPIPPPTALDTPPQTPEREGPEPTFTTDMNSTSSPSPLFTPLAGPLSSHPISDADETTEDSFAHLFARPTSMYSTVATFGRPSTVYDRDSFPNPLTPPPSGSRHAHRPSVLSRIFSRRNTGTSSSLASSSPSTPTTPFHRSTQSTFSGTHYHPNNGTCAFCDPTGSSSASSTFPPRGMKRINSTYSFQTSLKRNTTIYGGEFMSPMSSDMAASSVSESSGASTTRKSATFPRLMRQKSIDMLRRKSGNWFRDVEAEEEEEAARMRAAVAAREKEREREMRLLRELAERREDTEGEEEADADEVTLVGVEPPPMLPELSIVREREMGEVGEEDPAELFSRIGKEDDEITLG